MGQIGVLALIVETCHLHGALVEGPEHETFDLTGLAQFDGRVQLQKVAGSAIGVRLAVHHLLGVLILQVQHRIAPLPVALAQIADDVVGHIAANHLQAVLKHPHVADDHRAAIIRVVVGHSQLGHQFGAHTGRVAQKNAQNRQFIHENFPPFLFPKNCFPCWSSQQALSFALYSKKRAIF